LAKVAENCDHNIDPGTSVISFQLSLGAQKSNFGQPSMHRQDFYADRIGCLIFYELGFSFFVLLLVLRLNKKSIFDARYRGGTFSKSFFVEVGRARVFRDRVGLALRTLGSGFFWVEKLQNKSCLS
jgi:hypothetical protein